MIATIKGCSIKNGSHRVDSDTFFPRGLRKENKETKENLLHYLMTNLNGDQDMEN